MRPDDGFRGEDAAIYVRLGSKVDDGIGLQGGERLLDGFRVGNVCSQEGVTGVCGDRDEILEIARVGELIEFGYLMRRGGLRQEHTNEGGANESRATRYQNLHLYCNSQS